MGETWAGYNPDLNKTQSRDGSFLEFEHAPAQILLICENNNRLSKFESKFLLNPRISFIPTLFGTRDLKKSNNRISIYNPSHGHPDQLWFRRC